MGMNVPITVDITLDNLIDATVNAVIIALPHELRTHHADKLEAAADAIRRTVRVG